jgi:hypothetical protein
MGRLCLGLQRFGRFTPVANYLGLGMQVTRP